MVVHITQDLMMSSNASLAARQAGHKFKFVGSWDRALHFIENNDVQFLLIDLQTIGLDLDELSEGLAQLSDEQRPKTFAYAQHVEIELLAKANEMKIDQIMTRGQAHQGLADLLKAQA